MHFRLIYLIIGIVLLSSCKKEEVTPVNIVMLGHSLVAGVNWNRDLGRNDIINRGRGGQNIFDMKARLQKEVIDYTPKTCFILLGYEAQFTQNIDSSFATIKEMTNLLTSKNIRVVIQSSILYSASFENFQILNENLATYNNKVKNWVEVSSKDNIHFIDLNTIFAPNGIRFSHYTQDGIHLNAKGNEVWVGKIARFIINYNL